MLQIIKEEIKAIHNSCFASGGLIPHLLKVRGGQVVKTRGYMLLMVFSDKLKLCASITISKSMVINKTLLKAEPGNVIGHLNQQHQWK